MHMYNYNNTVHSRYLESRYLEHLGISNKFLGPLRVRDNESQL